MFTPLFRDLRTSVVSLAKELLQNIMLSSSILLDLCDQLVPFIEVLIYKYLYSYTGITNVFWRRSHCCGTVFPKVSVHVADSRYGPLWPTVVVDGDGQVRHYKVQLGDTVYELRRLTIELSHCTGHDYGAFLSWVNPLRLDCRRTLMAQLCQSVIRCNVWKLPSTCLLNDQSANSDLETVSAVGPWKMERSRVGQVFDKRYLITTHTHARAHTSPRHDLQTSLSLLVTSSDTALQIRVNRCFYSEQN